METYQNRGGNSSIDSYEIGNDFIVVWFKGASKSYTYSYSKAGRVHVEKMKDLARFGSGLGSYIMNNVRYKYD